MEPKKLDKWVKINKNRLIDAKKKLVVYKSCDGRIGNIGKSD